MKPLWSSENTIKIVRQRNRTEVLIVDSLRAIHDGGDPKLRGTLDFTRCLKIIGLFRRLNFTFTNNILRLGYWNDSRKLAESITLVEKAEIRKVY